MIAPSRKLEVELVKWRELLADLRDEAIEEALEGKTPPNVGVVSQLPVGRFPALTLIRGGRDA